MQALAILQRTDSARRTRRSPICAGLEWHYLLALATQTPLGQAKLGTEIYQIRLSPDGRELAAACKDESAPAVRPPHLPTGA